MQYGEILKVDTINGVIRAHYGNGNVYTRGYVNTTHRHEPTFWETLSEFITTHWEITLGVFLLILLVGFIFRHRDVLWKRTKYIFGEMTDSHIEDELDKYKKIIKKYKKTPKLPDGSIQFLNETITREEYLIAEKIISRLGYLLKGDKIEDERYDFYEENEELENKDIEHITLP